MPRQDEEDTTIHLTGLHGNARKLTYLHNALIEPKIKELNDPHTSPARKEELRREINTTMENIVDVYGAGWKREVALLSWEEHMKKEKNRQLGMSKL